MGRITEAIKSDDGKVRKANVVVMKEGKKTLLRPIKELIFLVRNKISKDPGSLGEECDVHRDGP